MQRTILAFFALLLLPIAASAQALIGPPPGYGASSPRQMILVPAPQQPAQPEMGGGFIEFLFNGGRSSSPPAPALTYPQAEQSAQPIYVNTAPTQSSYSIDPRYMRQEVAYRSDEAPGTIIIDTPNKFLYLIESHDRAIRYGIGVGRPGFTWSGVHKVSAKKEWPDWTPPEQMLERQPYLPHFMPGGPNNPLGARAMYLGSTLYRIHGSNEPWTIGHNVSSGCIRLTNQDVIDLYSRVKVGAKVIVL
ncbi:MAG TPA: L,D-transpeptidase [Pseudolabrys sp.]|nr:L,D-transpeptidase [Pseudolabrys sp.]